MVASCSHVLSAGLDDAAVVVVVALELLAGMAVVRGLVRGQLKRSLVPCSGKRMDIQDGNL